MATSHDNADRDNPLTPLIDASSKVANTNLGEATCTTYDESESLDNLLARYCSQIDACVTSVKLLDQGNSRKRRGSRSRMTSNISLANEMTKELYGRFRDHEFSAPSLMKPKNNSQVLTKPTTTTTNNSQNGTNNNDIYNSLTVSNRPARATFNKLRRSFQGEIIRLERITKTAADSEKSRITRMSSNSDASLTQSEMSMEESITLDTSVSNGEEVNVANVSDMEYGERSSSVDGDENLSLDGKPIHVRMIQQPADFNEILITERRREIEAIHGSMIKVNEVYRDLGNLVSEQQVEIDDIEQNIIASHSRAEAGFQHLEKAGETQMRTGCIFKWFIIVFIIAILVCLGYFIGPEIFKKKD